MAWAFTRKCSQGVWRYLRDVDEVISPRFFFCLHLHLGLINNKYNNK